MLGGYDYDELSESLATSPMGSDIYESSYNVLSLMSSMQDTQDDEFALVVKESEGKSELESDFEWPSGPVCRDTSGIGSGCGKVPIWICRCTRIPTTQRRPTTGGRYRGSGYSR